MVDAEATGRGYFATWHEAASNASQGSSKETLLQLIGTVAKESGASKATLDRILNEFAVAESDEGSQSDLAEDLSAWREISREISRHLGGNVSLDQSK
jgi:DNA helicase-2/ATP-dependent DNA helicase PcrA